MSRRNFDILAQWQNLHWNRSFNNILPCEKTKNYFRMFANKNLFTAKTSMGFCWKCD